MNKSVAWIRIRHHIQWSRQRRDRCGAGSGGRRGFGRRTRRSYWGRYWSGGWRPGWNAYRRGLGIRQPTALRQWLHTMHVRERPSRPCTGPGHRWPLYKWRQPIHGYTLPILSPRQKHTAEFGSSATASTASGHPSTAAPALKLHTPDQGKLNGHNLR